MLNTKSHTALIEDIEINLHQIWAILIKRKKTIIIITMIAFISTAIYVWKMVPVYSGKILIEVGSFTINNNPNNDKPTIMQSIDNIGDITQITMHTIETNASQNEFLTINTPLGSSSLIEISYEGNSKQRIKEKLKEISSFILNRHQEKITLYKNNDSKIRMTQIVGNIVIAHDPIKPKKELILVMALISGLIMGIFLSFLLEFIGITYTQTSNRETSEKK